MTPSNPEINRLIQQYLNSNLSDSEAEQLLAAAEASPEIQDCLFDHLVINTMLKDFMRGGYAQASLAKTVSEVIEHRDQPLAFYFHHHPILSSLVLLGALILVLSSPFYLRSVFDSWSSPVEQVAVVPEPVLIVKEPIDKELIVKESLPPVEASVAVLEEAIGAVWSEGNVPRVGEEIFPGKFSLETGLARVRFHSGVVLLMKEGTEVEFLTEDRISCLQGRLDAVVPPEAIGFRIDLADTSVIDLGTVFMVEASAKGSEVQVLKGKVALTSSSLQDSVLSFGQAVRLSRGKPRRYHADLSHAKRIESMVGADRETLRELYREEIRTRLVSAKSLVPYCPVISSRGETPGMTPNTIPAFRKAVERGVDAVELDVCASKDGDLFVIHPNQIKKFNVKKNRTGSLSQFTSEEVRKIDTATFTNKAEGERIPTLDETLEFFREETRVYVIVDMVQNGSELKVVEAIDRSGIAERIIVTGRNMESVRRIKEIRPGLCVGMQWGRQVPFDVALQELKLAQSDFIKMEYTGSNPALIHSFFENGIPTWSFMIDTREGMANCLRDGSVALMTLRYDVLLPGKVPDDPGMGSGNVDETEDDDDGDLLD